MNGCARVRFSHFKCDRFNLQSDDINTQQIFLKSAISNAAW